MQALTNTTTAPRSAVATSAWRRVPQAVATSTAMAMAAVVEAWVDGNEGLDTGVRARCAGGRARANIGLTSEAAIWAATNAAPAAMPARSQPRQTTTRAQATAVSARTTGEVPT